MSSAYKGPVLEIDKVCFGYEKERPVVKDFSLDLGNSEFIGLLGANGSGKSTILKLACGILKSFSGTVKLWDKPLEWYPNRDRAKLLSYLPQTLDINAPFRVGELAAMGAYPYDIPPQISVDEALAQVGLTEQKDNYIANLSGGERRRVYIAMTLLQGAGVLLLDEPLANLDIKYQIELIRLLRELRDKKNISIVMALHDINIALQFEKVVLIKEGRILGSGRPDNVLNGKMLREAFDVDVEVRKNGSEEAYVRMKF